MIYFTTQAIGGLRREIDRHPWNTKMMDHFIHRYDYYANQEESYAKE